MDDFKKDILKDVRRIQEEMDLLFDHFYRLKHSPVLTDRRVWRPPTDVFEREDQIVVLMEIAGMKPPDLNVTLSGDVLVIRGERPEKASVSRTVYQNMEINHGPFERNIQIHEPVDRNNIKATYQGGFLEILIPKKRGAISEKKEISIEVD
ncbi:MAG: Hsp20/alpha crystallin family protein [Candidatus Zixiibacteriota bacterium]